MIICLQHGIKGATRIATMKTLVGTFLLNSSQCVYPDKHIDRSILLPLIIKFQISQLLESMGYLDINFVKGPIDGHVKLTHLITTTGTRVTEFRQYILIGTHTRVNDTILVWMIRPTINYMTCIFMCSSDSYRSQIAVIKGVV